MAHAKWFRAGSRTVTLVLAVIVSFAASLVVALPAHAAPTFQAPFTCGQTWWGTTYENHSSGTYLNPTGNSYALDLNYGTGSDDEGAPILASADGTAVYEGYDAHIIRIDHGDGWATYYLHGIPASFLTDGLAHPVSAGDVIGTVSDAGSPGAVHLHYSQNKDGVQQQVTFGNSTYVASTSGAKIYITSGNCDPFVSTPVPTINGSSVVDSALSVDVGTWSPTPDALSYQWYRDGNILVGSSSTYTPTQADIGHPITVAVTATKTGYQVSTETSAPMSITASSFAFSGAPVTINGTPKVEYTLQAVSALTTSGVTTTVDWLKDDQPWLSNVSTVTLTEAEGGHTIKARYTFVKPGYQTISHTSAAVAVEGYSNYAFSGSPAAISGTAKVEYTLQSSSAITTPGTSSTITWLKDGVARQTGYSNTLVLSPSDVGHNITVMYTYDKQGYPAMSYTSPAVYIDGYSSYGFSAAPAAISGTAKVEYTLQASSGITTTGLSTSSLVWLRDGVTRQTGGSTLTLTSADIGHSITVRYTFDKQGYQTQSFTSSAVTVAGYSYFSFSGLPASISGTSRVGYTVQATSGLTTTGVTRTFQWYRNGVAITGATGSTRTLTSLDYGKSITVKITFDRQGYQATSYTSAARTVTY